MLAEVAPRAGRLVLFDSKRFFHEVHPAPAAAPRGCVSQLCVGARTCESRCFGAGAPGVPAAVGAVGLDQRRGGVSA